MGIFGYAVLNASRPIIRHAGHRWYCSDDSTLGKAHYRLERVSFMADLKRYGNVPTVIDVAKEVIDYENR